MDDAKHPAIITMSTRTSPVDGQSHDRLAGDASLLLPNTIPVPMDDGPSDEITELTTGQKMLSATSGSLLTGLLGEYLSPDSL